MARYADYKAARAVHSVTLLFTNIKGVDAIKLYDDMLVANGPPISDELPHSPENSLYYDALNDKLYARQKWVLESRVTGKATDEVVWGWHLQSTNVSKDDTLPIIQFYYDLYHADSK